MLLRREFLKMSGQVPLAVAVIGLLRSGVSFAKDVVYKVADLAVTKKNATAKTMEYVEDSSKAKNKAAKMGVAPDKQSCSNCTLYMNPGILEGSKAPAGQCALFAMQVVHGSGWCKQWSKKA